MATRLYANSRRPAFIDNFITPHSSWDVTTNYKTCQLWNALPNGSNSVSSEGAGTFNTTKPAIAGPFNVLAYQCILFHLDAQTISGTIAGFISAQEDTATADCHSQIVVRVVSPTGTVRGVLYGPDAYTTTLSLDANGTEFSTSVRSRRCPSGSGTHTLTSVAAQAGDMLVIEVGYRITEAGAGTRTIQIGLNMLNGWTDNTADDQATSTTNSWFEFSGTITQTPAAQVYFGLGSNAVTKLAVPGYQPAASFYGQRWPRGSGREQLRPTQTL